MLCIALGMACAVAAEPQRDANPLLDAIRRLIYKVSPDSYWGLKPEGE